MCIGGGSAPSVKAAPVAPGVIAPLMADSVSGGAGEDERRRRQAASGRSDTVLTGGMGLAQAARTGGKQLLGQ